MTGGRVVAWDRSQLQAGAEEVLELLVRTYPRSDEADLARERLRTGTP